MWTAANGAAGIDCEIAGLAVVAGLPNSRPIVQFALSYF
jgi:hypothetical protein